MVGDIAAWLEEVGLGKYSEVFVKNEIGVEVLPHLSEQDLVDLGLPLKTICCLSKTCNL